MELFDRKGCLTDEGLQALMNGELDELGRLEAADHLAYCDRCIDRYTALLSKDRLQTPEQSVVSPVMKSLWVRIMRNTLGRAAVAGVAAVLALTLWGSGGLQKAVNSRNQIPTRQEGLQQPVVAQAWDAAESWLDELFTNASSALSAPAEDGGDAAPDGRTQPTRGA